MVYSRITSLAVALLLALEVTVAQPHGNRQHRRSPKAEAISRPEPEISYETEYVCVDQYGNPIDAPSADQSTPTPTPSSTPQAVPEPLDTTSSINKRVVSVSGSCNKPGVVYSPYNADGTCKSASQVSDDIAKISSFCLIRLYGTDCEQVPKVLAAVKQYNIKLFLGINDISAYSTEITIITTAVGGDWSMIHTVAIGNEQVSRGTDPNTVVAALNDSRTRLRNSGYTGPVVTVDTWVAIMAHPILCENSDYIAANCHPFFDRNVAASGAGSFLTVQGQNVQNSCPGKDLLITETGWPHQGTGHDQASVSVADQATALKSMWSAKGKDMIMLSAFDDLWKNDNPATYNAEKYWGIQDYNYFS